MQVDGDMSPSNIPVSPTSSLGSWTQPLVKDYYCGYCFIDCGPSSGQQGCKWQQYGDWTLNEKKWIYLRPSCNNFLWRLFSKHELEWDAPKAIWMKDYKLFLKFEIEAAHKQSSS